MDIDVRVVPGRTLATISREVKQPELDDFIRSSFDQLFAWAQEHEDVRPIDTSDEWPTLVMFHGPVTEEESALVVVAAVVSDSAPETVDLDPDAGIEFAEEAEHQEAFIALTKAGLDFPEILQAYDELAMWVDDNAAPIEGMVPREVYITDVMAAEDEDVVASVAMPFEPTD